MPFSLLKRSKVDAYLAIVGICLKDCKPKVVKK